MPRLFLLLCLSLALCSCATLYHRDRALLESHRVTGALYDKMMHHEPLTLDDIVALSRKGVPGPFIVHYLQPTYTVFKLTPGDVVRLRQAKVEDGVIRYLLATPSLYSPSSVPVWYDDGPHSDEPYWDYRRY